MMNTTVKVLDSASLQAIAQDILQLAKNAGADQAEVSMTTNKGFSVSVHGGDVETVEYNQDKAVDIHVYFGKRMGSASLSDMRPEAIRAAVDAACHIAKFTGEDPMSGLADKEDLAFNYPEVAMAAPWNLTVEQAIELAIECERDAIAQDKRIMSAEETRVATSDSFYLTANSHGFMGYFPFTRHEISCVLVAKENDEMQRDYCYTVSSDPSRLDSIQYIAKTAAERTVRRLGSRRLSTIKAPVIFIAEEARGLLGSFAAAISGGNLYRKSSFLIDKLGTKIFPDFIRLQEHPHLAHALGSSPFDNDGLLTRDNVFVEDGILKSYALGMYSARQLGMKPTGNGGGMHNLTISHGDKSLAQLLKTMDKGLLITEMMGQGTNIVTGDYSRGAGGFWVENGEIQFPVSEVTVAGNLPDIYARIAEVGNDVDLRGNIRSGSILIDEMMIAGG